MERIKLAIEKAKASAGAVPTDARPVQVRHPADQEGEGMSPAVIGSLADIQYVQTTVVSLDQTHLEQNRVIAMHKNHQASWAFDVLRTQVLQKMDENGWRTIGVTSPSVESGKSMVSINLAMSIAHQTDRTALLVDFDLRRPRVAATLGLQPKVSLNEVLQGQADIADAMLNPSLPRLVILPTMRPMPNASELLSSARVASLIGELRERYRERIVIFDLPPVLAADDVMAVIPRLDCVLMVVASGMSTEKDIEESMSVLSRANVLGVVLNKDRSPTRNAYY